jgi:hypothetical protein
MKFMIITYNVSWGTSICELARKLGIAETLISSHEQAMANFLEFSPTHVLVDYYEYKEGVRRSAKYELPIKVWEDIKNSASPEQILRRCGFIELKEADFILLPLNEQRFKESFNLA